MRAAVLEWFWRESQRSAPGDLFWTTAAVPHPADAVPRPRGDYLPHAFGPDGERLDDPRMRGHIFIDGSCTTSVFRGLERAAFALIQLGDDGNLLKTVSVPVWDSLPQTSQAAERGAYAAVPQIIDDDSTIYGDCQGVINAAMSSDARRLDGRKRYAGVMLSMRKYPLGMARIRDTVKVKEHPHEAALTCPVERWRARGNNFADEAAKAARGRHPQPGVDITSLVAFWTKRAPYIVRAVGVAMTEFPAAGGHLKRRNGGGTAAASGDQSQGDAADRHSWTYAEGRWRCAKCWTYVLGESVRPRRVGSMTV